jgi:hypothetical protein
MMIYQVPNVITQIDVCRQTTKNVLQYASVYFQYKIQVFCNIVKLSEIKLQFQTSNIYEERGSKSNSPDMTLDMLSRLFHYICKLV